MNNDILRMAAELGIPLTVRRIPGGVIFWRSSAEDLQQAQEAASRRHTVVTRLGWEGSVSRQAEHGG
jgi:hypothetical protein